MYTTSQVLENSNQIALSTETAKLVLAKDVFELISTLPAPMRTKDLAKLIAQTSGTSPQAAISLLEKVTDGYKNFKGVQLLVAVELEGKRAFRSVTSELSSEKEVLPVIVKATKAVTKAVPKPKAKTTKAVNEELDLTPISDERHGDIIIRKKKA